MGYSFHPKRFVLDEINISFFLVLIFFVFRYFFFILISLFLYWSFFFHFSPFFFWFFSNKKLKYIYIYIFSTIFNFYFLTFVLFCLSIPYAQNTSHFTSMHMENLKYQWTIHKSTSDSFNFFFYLFKNYYWTSIFFFY